MKDMIIATKNKDKLCEISSLLRPLGINCISLFEIGFKGEITEDGETFFENAYKKASYIAETYKIPTLGDDSGLIVNALPGELGVHSRRFSPTAIHADNNALLLERMKDIEDRQAHFVSQLVLYFPGGRFFAYQGRIDGEIATDLKGDHGFGYDPLFIVEGKGKRMAELTREEKNAISHRGRALAKLIEDIKNETVGFQ